LVRSNLLTRRDVARRPLSGLQGEHDDWVQHVGPLAREALEQAMCALPPHQRAPLRREVAKLDRLFLKKTLNSPGVHSTPWWFRRC
jgi:hypothetical protein